MQKLDKINNPFQGLLLYRALRLHFTSNYDIEKYHGKVSGDNLKAQIDFQNDRTRYYYADLVKHPNPQNLIIANLIDDPKRYITNIVGEVGKVCYAKWEGRQEALHYNLSQELELFPAPADLLKITPSGLPNILEKYIAGTISPESVVLIDSVTHRLDTYVRINHPLIDTCLLKLRKYRSFYIPDKEKIKKIFEKQYC